MAEPRELTFAPKNKHGISDATFYKWMSEYAGKRMYANQTLEKWTMKNQVGKSNKDA